MPDINVPFVDTVVWAPEFEVGVPEMDEDHRILVAIYNDLAHAVQRGASLAMRREVVETFIRFFVDHTEREERLMRRHGYCDVAAHRREHEIDPRHLDAAVGLLTDESESLDAVRLLRDWMVNHLLVSDKALFAHLNTQERPTSTES